MKRLIAASAIFAGLCVPFALAGTQSSSAAPSQKQQTQTQSVHKKAMHKKHHRAAKHSTKTPNQPTSTKKS